MVGAAHLSGYLLEEVLGHLLQSSGYRLLDAADDRGSLVWAGNGLRVRGRGAEHQADALGDLDFTVPFSMPIRLFVEAKNLSHAIGIDVARNAVGVLHDVNQFAPEANGTLGRFSALRRVQYRYSIFSTSGFTQGAQEYAVAHQISLIDLSGPTWGHLGTMLRESAKAALQVQNNSNLSQHARHALRYALSDMDPGAYDAPRRNSVQVSPEMSTWARMLARNVMTSASGNSDILLGFVDAPFVLALRPDDPDAFYQAIQFSGGPISVRISYDSRGPAGGGDWVVTAEDPHPFRLAFPLPGILEEMLLATPREEQLRFASMAKRDFLTTITVYVGGNPVQLSYHRSPTSSSDRFAADARDTTELRRIRSDPTLARDLPRTDEVDAVQLHGTWSSNAVFKLLDWLHEGGYAQEKLIRYAARNGGRISREDIYHVARLDPERTLRGLARPTLRARTNLIADGILPPDASPAFTPEYSGGSTATHYVIPPEFVQHLSE